MINVVLLDPDPMMAEAAWWQVGSSNVTLRRNEKLNEACSAVVLGHVKKQVLLWSTLDAKEEDHLQV